MEDRPSSMANKLPS